MATDSRGLEGLKRIAGVEMPPLTYYELVADFNILLLNELGHQLTGVRDKLGIAFSIGTTGSDGRQEAGSKLSKYEAIIVVGENVDLGKFETAVIKIIEETVPGRFVNFEVKGPNSSMMAYKGDRKRLQSGRIGDLRLIPGAGDRTHIFDAKHRLGQEIIAANSDTIDDVVGLKRDAARATREGKNRIGGKDALHFDLIARKVFFDPEGNQRSFKIGPLRLVQNTLLVEEVRHTRREKDPGFISSLHSGIKNRLSQLSDDRLLSIGREFVHELQEHYAFFLRLYHQSEHHYEQRIASADPGVRALATEREFTPSENEEIAKRLAQLQELTERLKIGKQATPQAHKKK